MLFKEPMCGHDAQLGLYHTFACRGLHCKHFKQQFDSGKASNMLGTQNLWGHVKSCWGVNAKKVGKAAGTKDGAKESIINPTHLNGTIMFVFKCQCKQGKVIYSTRPHTSEAR